MKDLSADTHAQLDAKAAQLSSLDDNIFLGTLFLTCCGAYADIWPIDMEALDVEKVSKLLESRPEIRILLQTAHATGRYSQIRNLPAFHTSEGASHQQHEAHFMAGKRQFEVEMLRKAYNRPFHGKVAADFIDYLIKTDKAMDHEFIYAKAASIVQSSGTGKSRMLTEAGKAIFTLPICLRDPRQPGYPLSDKAVWEYFANLHSHSDLSYSAHAWIACFLGAAHSVMLKCLKEQPKNTSPRQLLRNWNTLMEDTKSRAEFFETVVDVAKTMASSRPVQKHSSPKRDKNGDPDVPCDIGLHAKDCYGQYAKKATEDLAKFASSLNPQKPIVVTYFDEAHELKISYWMLLRLVAIQHPNTPMWYVFMGTQSSITTFNPAPQDMLSLRLRKEIERLLEPYIAVGFDQNAIHEGSRPVIATMGQLQSIEYLCRYGRPMWYALFLEGEEDNLVSLASLKLTCGKFNPLDRDHVLAVLSQRVCVDTVLVSSDALALAGLAVAKHMRLLTGVSPNQRIFHTNSPSEPMLALGAARLLYGEEKTILGQVLDTFSRRLCEAGLVEKGLLGEIAGCILLTVARDLAAPRTYGGRPDLLQPVRLMDFLDKLFGNEKWTNPCRKAFDEAFDDTYINFTHWIVTKDPLPEKPSQQLLANLWARSSALQCCFRQESIDLMIVTYKGRVDANAIFDVENLSATNVQIKNKVDADTKAGPAIRPLGIPRSIRGPLPYIALLMELGNESKHKHSDHKIKVTASPLQDDGSFDAYWEEHESAVKQLHEYKVQKETEKQQKQAKQTKTKQTKDAREAKLEKEVEAAQAKMDACNRFSIYVRGASPEIYGALCEAEITAQFAHLLSVTIQPPTAQDTTMRYSRPLERLDEASDYNAWMSVYVGDAGDEEEDGKEEGKEGNSMDTS